MAAWSDFYPDVLLELPQIPLVLADHWLRNTAIEFCQRTRAHVVDLNPIDAVADQIDYAIVAPANLALVVVSAVVFDGEPLAPASPRALARKFGDWKTRRGTPQHYTSQALGTLLIVPGPAASAAGAIEIEAVVKPADDAATIDDDLFQRYRLDLAAGMKGKLMAMSERPWTNAKMAAVYLAQFEAAVNAATAAAAAGNVSAQPRFSGDFC
jgi:hypothetical protein